MQSPTGLEARPLQAGPVCIADRRIQCRASSHKFVGIGSKLHEYEASRAGGNNLQPMKQKPACQHCSRQAGDDDR
jgi:hypothetical protein